MTQSLPLIVQVWDEDEVTDELIGQTSINFISLVRGQRQERWYTITAEGYKAFRAVQDKTDSTHAGKVLLGITLDFAHTFETQEHENDDRDTETQVVSKWGTETTSVAEDFDITATKLSASSLNALLQKRMELIRNGINIAVKNSLYTGINSLVKACVFQDEGNLYEGRLLIEEAQRFAERELKMLHNDTEERLLAAKIMMACIAFKYSHNLEKTSAECKALLLQAMQLPDVVTSVADELTGSDPDHKYLRTSDAAQCCCTENQPGARIFRHRLLSDIRNLTLSCKEELNVLDLRGGAPNVHRIGREGTQYPGPNGRDVDNCLELISCADPITLKGHFQAINAVCVSGDWIFSACDDKTVRVWCLTTCKCIRVLDLHHLESIRCLTVCPGRFDMQLFSGAENIKSYNIMDSVLQSDKRIPCVHTLAHHNGAITCMVTDYYTPKFDFESSPAGWRLYSGSVDRNIHVYETVFIGTGGMHPDEPRPVAVLKGHRSTITTMKVARNCVFSGGLDSTIMVGEFSPGQEYSQGEC